MKARCADCGLIKESFACVTVNGQERHCCEPCWQKKRDQFTADLERGDPKAKRLYVLLKAVSRSAKSKQ